MEGGHDPRPQGGAVGGAERARHAGSANHIDEPAGGPHRILYPGHLVGQGEREGQASRVLEETRQPLGLPTLAPPRPNPPVGQEPTGQGHGRSDGTLVTLARGVRLVQRLPRQIQRTYLYSTKHLLCPR